ncbi:hypothetical protein A2363_05080 [Candidatus Gottesmanbacteria bacterium RIFOXYB1_FULL_47_11]|uniref:Uncharacterized protein n=1 Tax=Candidatus Gottesmanbacteria bacterium RIFOXYB1_FULL_47_11 TaxID=1798401 RepID=A0A1F6BF98_9BACT|nr:MAG: hypothetical protein A2363_05080 [Candidatus Gottesmanbacteria bacterium RIFOXYB1_FULL_47_11]
MGRAYKEGAPYTNHHLLNLRGFRPLPQEQCPRPELPVVQYKIVKTPPEWAFVVVEKDFRFIPVCLWTPCADNNLILEGNTVTQGNMLMNSGQSYELARYLLTEHLLRTHRITTAPEYFQPYGVIIEQSPIKEYPFRKHK